MHLFIVLLVLMKDLLTICELLYLILNLINFLYIHIKLHFPLYSPVQLIWIFIINML